MSKTLPLPLKERPSALNRAAFMNTYSGIYENSPWVAETLWHSVPHTEIDTVEGFARAAQAVVDRADRDSKLRLMRAHPDLAGHVATAAPLTPSSAQEQSSAGLDRCSPEELEKFQILNTAYREKFGFPFILAVRGRNKQEIFAVFTARLQNMPEQEFDNAMVEIHKIARLRLTALCSQPSNTGV